MFTKEYIFETRWTRHRRGLVNFFLFVVFLLATVTTLCVWIPLFAENKTRESEAFLYERTPDLIAVFTGDRGRIPEALEAGEQYPDSKILISGVYKDNSLNTIYKYQLSEIKREELSEIVEVQSQRIEIDYSARNTIENVISTFQFLHKHSGLENVLIISHDYHILRISLILQGLKTPEGEFNFHFRGVKSDYGQWHNLRVLFKEVFKLAKTGIFLLLWDA